MKRPLPETKRRSRSPRAAPLRSGGWRALFAVRGSPIHRRGGFALRAIARGSRIIEYTGRRLTHAEADALHRQEGEGPHHTFLFTLDRDTVIDPAVGGNAARYLNHSCEPNCAPVREGGRLFIEAIRTIAPGEELTYDYAIRRLGTADEEPGGRFDCRCGARRCRGTLLSVRGG